MIRRADLEDAARNALVMNLGDLQAHAESMISQATERAERIVREANAERDRLIAGAHAEGYNAGFEAGRSAGHAEGLAQGTAEARASQDRALTTLIESWTRAAESFEQQRDSMLSAARSEVVRLAAEIATRVTRRAVELDPDAVLPQIQAVLGTLVRPSRLVIRVHPDDLVLATAEMPELVARFDLCRHAELLADHTLERGSCVASTDEGGRIDAGIGSQLARIIEAMMPAESVIRIERSARGDAA
jgi:flagellar assembly protein FliH